MKKFIIYVIFVLVTGFSAYFGYGAYLSSQYDGTAIPYIQEVLPKISTWDADRVRPYVASELLQTVTEEDFNNLMQALSKIGTLQSIEEMKFKGKSGEQKGQLKQSTIITYEVAAKYSTGDAIVTISLFDRDGSYEISQFNFQSAALAQ